MNKAVSSPVDARDAGVGDQAALRGDVTPILIRYWTMALRRRWVLLAAILGSLALALIATFLTTPQYTAATTIEISREGQRVVDIKGVENENNIGDLEFYQTQYGLLRSRALAEKVATEMKLDQNASFFEMFGKEGLIGEGSMFKVSKPIGGISESARQARVRAAGQILIDNIEVTPQRLSRLVEVAFVSPDPQLSAQIANAWAMHFIQSNLARRFDATSYARQFLEKRLDQLRQRLEQSEKMLVGYASDQRIINLPSAPGTQDQPGVERSLLADDLSSLNAALATAIADQIRAGSRLAAPGNTGALGEAVNNQVIGPLRQKRAELASQYQQVLIRFAPQYLGAREIASQIAELDKSVAREEDRIRTLAKGEYAAATARVETLQGRVNSLKAGYLDERRRSIQYNIYQREADTNRQLYDGLLQRYKEIGIAGGVGTNNVAIVDRADIPQKPSSPRLLVNLLIALLAGMAIGIVAALALEQIDDAISSPEDVERLLALPMLGTIPKALTETPLDELADRKSALVESYLSVQTNLQFATHHGTPTSIAVTSTRPSEGKSTTAYAIAHALAQGETGKRVILIDSDMRSPSLHKQMGMNNEAGTSNFLSGSDNLTGLIHRSSLERLSIMTAGPQPPNAAELLTGDRFRQLIALLEKTYDHIVIDSPPVMGLADAPLIASQVEATIFVIESRGIRSALVRIAVNRLIAAKANIVGALLTKFDDRHAFGYYYDYGYGYGRKANATSSTGP